MIKISEEVKVRVDRWSFSRLSSFVDEEKKDDCAKNNDDEGCNYCWYKNYREGNRGIGNGFAGCGTAYHKKVEDYLQDKVFDFELYEKFLTYYYAGWRLPSFEYGSLEYYYLPKIEKHFANFNIFDQFEIISVEEELEFEFEGEKFVTIPDVLAKDKFTSRYAVIDHKSSKPFKKEKAKRKLRQLYMNCRGIYEKYGVMPQDLYFNHFRTGDFRQYDFVQKDYDATFEWATRKIKAIREEKEFTPRCLNIDTDEDFYANQLCNHRNSCEYKKINNKAKVM